MCFLRHEVKHEKIRRQRRVPRYVTYRSQQPRSTVACLRRRNSVKTQMGNETARQHSQIPISCHTCVEVLEPSVVPLTDVTFAMQLKRVHNNLCWSRAHLIRYQAADRTFEHRRIPCTTESGLRRRARCMRSQMCEYSVPGCTCRRVHILLRRRWLGGAMLAIQYRTYLGSKQLSIDVDHGCPLVRMSVVAR